MSIIGVIGIAVVTSAVILMLNKTNGELSMLLSVCSGAFILLFILVKTVPILDSIKGFFEGAGVGTQYFEIAFKSLGICYVSQFAADVCKDFGQSALSKKIELSCKVLVVALSLPLMKTIIETVLKLMV